MQIYNIPSNTAETIILLLFLISFIIQFYFWVGVHSRHIFKRSAKKETAVHNTPVSVIICAKNEAENLKKNLPLILDQEYEPFEVIVVNDCSEDNTETVLENFKKEYPRLRTTRINRDNKFTHGKKLALTLGIKAAKNEWVLLTDADCKPAGGEWINEMGKHFIEGKSIVLGYGKYESKKGFLNRVIRLDTMFTAMQYLSSAMAGFPYMGVGRNLAYRRSLFFENKGFYSHLKLQSGDDDLFINEVANSKNTAVEYDPQAHTLSMPAETWREWVSQKQRHLTTCTNYRRSTKIFLGSELASRVLFYASFLYGVICSTMPLPIVFLFLSMLLIKILILKFVSTRFNEKKILLISPLYNFFMPIVNFAVWSTNLISTKRNKWK